MHWGADPRSAGGKPEKVHVHWAKPLVLRHPDALEDPIENVLASQLRRSAQYRSPGARASENVLISVVMRQDPRVER